MITQLYISKRGKYIYHCVFKKERRLNDDNKYETVLVITKVNKILKEGQLAK